MSLKYLNANRTLVQWNDAVIMLDGPDDWDSIGDELAKEQIKEWIAAGNMPAIPLQSLEDIKGARIAKISDDCRAAIEAGFLSSALGSPHLYPAKMQDQANLNASVTASLIPALPADWVTPFWCADESGAWNYAMHTAQQIQQVGMDGKAAIVQALMKNAQLANQVNEAQTQAEVEAIQWSV